MRRRTPVAFSADPGNADATLVRDALARMPSGKRSQAIWFWAAEYLRGRAADPQETDAAQEEAARERMYNLLDDL